MNIAKTAAHLLPVSRVRESVEGKLLAKYIKGREILEKLA